MERHALGLSLYPYRARLNYVTLSPELLRMTGNSNALEREMAADSKRLIRIAPDSMAADVICYEHLRDSRIARP